MSTSALYRKTPCIQSADDASIFFKCEFLQPSGSFKDRGISHMIQTLNSGGNVTRLVCSSGGNAGHAVATAAQVLGLPADIFVPVSTLPMMVDKLRARGANVTVVGANWNEADSEARKFLSTDSSFAYIPPFDHELIWRGNSSIVDEIVSDFDVLPDTIVLSVGGGGLLRGIQLGLERFGLTKSVKIIACETEGAASFAAAKSAGHVVRLKEINTIASTLGALAVTPSTLEGDVEVISCVVSDADAVRACLQFASQHRILVEPACGAALAAIYCDGHRQKYLSQSRKICVIACGGSAVSLDLLDKWSKKFSI